MIVGVEITSDALRAVCFERFDAKKIPARVHEVALPSSSGQALVSSDGLSAAIAELVSKIEMPKARIAVAIPSAACLFRVASFPYRAEPRIAKTLGYAMEDRVPGSVDEYIIEPVSNVIEAGDLGARVGVVACPVQEVGRILHAFQSAGVDPCIIQPSIVSLVRYVALRESSGATESVLIVRPCGNVCELAWADSGELRASQTIPLRSGSDPASEDASVLADKIAFAVRAYQVCDGSAGFDRVLVVESGDRGKALSMTLKDRLRVPVSECSASAIDGRFTGAWGVAAEAAMRKHSAPTLRRGQHAYRPFALRLERRIAVALVLSIGILCMLGIRTMREISTAQQALTSLAEHQSNLFKSMGVVGGTIYGVDAVLGPAREAAQTAERNRMVSCIERWRALKALAPAMALMTFEKIDINQTRTLVTVMARDGTVARRFRERISASETFLPDTDFKQKTIAGKGVSLQMELRYR